MIPPKVPDNETQRLRTLQSMRILDTPSEESFDQITRMAKRLFNVPIALVSLVDENRQWFKSRQGLDTSETPRDVSFCGHAILDDRILHVEDAKHDERFHDNPLVCNAPDVRFYAGYPLKAPNGHRVGTLCLIDNVPRAMTDADHELLSDLGQLVEQQLRALALATTDELTRISNRRGFHILAPLFPAITTRAQFASSLLVFALDNFKRINDVEGHDAGDRALGDFARCLLLTCREADVLGRTGGDEFCALLWNTDEAGTARMVERLGQRIAEVNLERPGHLPLAFSVGIASASGTVPAGLGSMIAAADEAMFADKAARRRNSAASAARGRILLPDRQNEAPVARPPL